MPGLLDTNTPVAKVLGLRSSTLATDVIVLIALTTTVKTLFLIQFLLLSADQSQACYYSLIPRGQVTCVNIYCSLFRKQGPQSKLVGF